MFLRRVTDQEGNRLKLRVTNHLTPNLSLVNWSKSSTPMKLTKAYPTLQPYDRSSAAALVRVQGGQGSPFWKSIRRYIKSIRRGHTFATKDSKSLSLILFGMFLIITVVLVSSPCSILFKSS